jgi:Mce-associated membrane protein
VEDQSSVSSGLTDDTEEPAADEASPDGETVAEPDADEEAVSEEASPDGETVTEPAAEGEAVVPGKPRIGRRVRLAAVGLSLALFVGAGAFAGAAVQPYVADRALVATKLKVVQTAVNAINTLWNYTPETMDTLVDRASVYLTGDLEADYRKFIDTIAAANKQAKVTDSTEIVGAAVEKLEDRHAVVLVYTNTTATSELTKTIPSLKYQSNRLFMRRDHNRWLVTKMPTVTSLNLTPKL